MLCGSPYRPIRSGSVVDADCLAMKLRRCPPVVHARHLPGELVEVGGGLARHEDGGVLAMPVAAKNSI
ncbi:MAG: hypothetical protein ABSC63_20205 [Candidatus Binataceae bacterium]